MLGQLVRNRHYTQNPGSGLLRSMSANASWLKIHAFWDKELTRQTLNLQHVGHGIHRVQIGSPKLGRSDHVRQIDIIQMKQCCLLLQRWRRRERILYEGTCCQCA